VLSLFIGHAAQRLVSCMDILPQLGLVCPENFARELFGMDIPAWQYAFLSSRIF